MAIAELSEETSPPSPFVLCAGGCGCGTGGSGRPNHLGATSRRFFAPCLPFCSPLTMSACLVSFALSGSSLAVGCLCALRRLPLVVFCVTGHFAGLTRTSAGTVAAILRAYRCMTDSFRWLEGAEGHRRVRSARRCSAVCSACGWIGCFSQPQCHSRYSSSFPSPLRHVFPPSSHTSLMRQPPTVARGARHRHRRRPPAMFRKPHISSTEAL